MDSARALPELETDDGIEIHPARRAADRRAIARIPVVPEGLDLEAIAHAINETEGTAA